MKGCAVTADLARYERQMDDECAAESFRETWVQDNKPAMVARLLSNTDYRTETLADYYLEADAAYAAALEGDAALCARIIANLLRKAAEEDAQRLLVEFAADAFKPFGKRYDDIPSAHDVKTRWD